MAVPEHNGFGENRLEARGVLCTRAKRESSALRVSGQTPDEMYYGTGGNVAAELEAARQQARQARAEANRQWTCSACETVTVNLN